MQEHHSSDRKRDIFDHHRSLRALVALAIGALTIFIFQAVWSALVVVGDVIVIFLLAWIISFILEPLVALLQRVRLSRVVAVSLVYLLLLVAVAGGIALAIPAISFQANALAAAVNTDLSPANVARIEQTAVDALHQFGMAPADARQLVRQVSAQLPGRLTSLTQQVVGSASALVSSILAIILDASLIVILSFYMMLEGGALVERVVTRLPPAWIPWARLFQEYVDSIFAGYFRAQLIIAAIYAAGSWLVLSLLGAPGAWFVALISGILLLLPVIGAFLAVAPPALVVLIVTPPNQVLIRLVLLVFLLGAAQHVVLNLIAPRIFGQHMGVPTIILFAALLLGGAEGGVWGAFFAAPIIALAYALARTIYERFSAVSPLFAEQRALGDTRDAPQDTPPPDASNGRRDPPQPDATTAPEYVRPDR